MQELFTVKMNLNKYYDEGLNYQPYLDEVKRRYEEIMEAGDPQGYGEYYAMNLRRMERLNKNFELSETQKSQLKSPSDDFRMLVITEGWCGDAAQSVPVIHSVMDEMGVDSHYVFRDEHPELMDAYLTQGSRSIPIFIGVDKDGKELFHWGPRPQIGMEMLEKHKSHPDSYSEQQFHEDLQVWYNHDKGETIFNEFLEAIK